MSSSYKIPNYDGMIQRRTHHLAQTLDHMDFASIADNNVGDGCQHFANAPTHCALTTFASSMTTQDTAQSMRT